jgi:pyruvate/2-oxoglutarate dehydrogenase complex dihydrolipoamide acyltransferase (E2) component
MPENCPPQIWSRVEHDFLLDSSMSDFDDWIKQNSTLRPQETHTEGISPLAKRLAEESHLDWRTLKGSGKNGLILERDVLQAIAKKI